MSRIPIHCGFRKNPHGSPGTQPVSGLFEGTTRSPETILEEVEKSGTRILSNHHDGIVAANHGGEARDEEKIPVGHEMDHAAPAVETEPGRDQDGLGTLTVVQGEKERVLIELDVFEAFKSQRPPVEQGQERAAQVPGSGLSFEMRQRTAPNFPHRRHARTDRRCWMGRR